MMRNLIPYRNAAFALLLVLLVVIGILRISSTYSIFWQTWDEPSHIAAGMEWLDRGQYTYERGHPPLARVMSALGPYLNGIRSTGKEDKYDEGNTILQANGVYERNLTLARLGILPFFIISCLVVAFWAKVYQGVVTPLLSVLLFTTLPTILGHAGVATLDMACAALVAAALFAIDSWLDRPTLLRSLLMGITFGLAVLVKFSSLVFLTISGVLIGVIHGFRLFRKTSFGNGGLLTAKRWIAASVIALTTCFLVIWSGYRFSYEPVSGPEHRPHDTIDRTVGAIGPLHDTAYFVLENMSLPAPEFWEGIYEFIYKNKSGHTAYLLGEIRTHGWWYFFPLLLLLKTPVPFILFSVIGIFYAFRNVISKQEDIRLLSPAVLAIGILAVSMLGSVNNGTRQVLVVYPLLAIVGGYGASRLLSLNRNYRYIGALVTTVLLSWQIVSSFAAHPDYLAYFNELAGNHPEEIVVDSDLDWGQDLKRLATTLNKRKIDEVAIQYNGSLGINLYLFNLPTIRGLAPYQRTTGWIAISVFHLKLGTTEPPYDQYSWLKEYEPVEKVGKSIWLYYIPDNNTF